MWLGSDLIGVVLPVKTPTFINLTLLSSFNTTKQRVLAFKHSNNCCPKIWKLKKQQSNITPLNKT